MSDPQKTVEKKTPDGKEIFKFNPETHKVIPDPDRPGFFELERKSDLVKEKCGGDEFEYNPKTHKITRNPANPAKCLVRPLIEPGDFTPTD